MGNSDSKSAHVARVMKSMPDVEARHVGDEETMDYRVHCLDKMKEGGQISMWHDIKLFPTHDARAHNVVNMINEIPKCSRKKFEIATNEVGNPIKQDVKKGKLREFTKGDVYFNYGCLPRTWEDPDIEHPDAKARGDNDPLDVCEIGLRILKVGEVVPVKVLGCLCLIDEGEADWKIIAIAITDPWAALLNDVTDMEEKLPGTVHSIREWFRTYKITDGKPENKFGLEGRCMNAEYSMGIIAETHHAWRQLVLGEKDQTPSEKCSLEAAVNASEPAQGSMKRNLSYPKLNLEDINEIDTNLPTEPAH